MLLNFHELIDKYNLKINGVIHAGAHFGEEFPDYIKAGIENIVFIEPCSKAFNILSSKFHNTPNVVLYNCALGDKNGHQDMFIETENEGQSNSLLKPAGHLTQHTEITFSEPKETVIVDTLDTLFGLKRDKYNMLMMDCQGYEGYIIKGGQEVLKGIDVVYSEVNKSEVYAGNTLVTELDQILSEFDRVETEWCGDWGDALYVRNKQAPSNTQDVPEEFRPHMHDNYPHDNDLPFEEWFYDYFKNNSVSSDISLTYLPIFWSSYYVNNKYGQDKEAITRLQSFIDTLDKSKKYFTIIQFDDGILNDLTGLDVKVFAMSTDKYDYVLPLICKPHQFSFGNIKKDLMYSFIGRLTHPIRQQMIDSLPRNPDANPISFSTENSYISTDKHELEDYCRTLARSRYVLCPRGYGATSFHIMEALQYGAIPVYISDEHVIPHSDIHFADYGVVVNSGESIFDAINTFEEANGWAIINSDGSIVNNTQLVAQKYFDSNYTFEVNGKLIIEKTYND